MNTHGMTVEQLVATHGVALLRLAAMLAGTRTDAEDLVQNTLVRLLAHEQRLTQADSPVAYARRTLVNEFISEGRRAWRQKEYAVETLPERATDAVVETTRPGPDDDAWRLLTTLPRKQRAVLALRYYEDLSDAEIADVLDISASTVRSNAARGLATLRGLLATRSTTTIEAGS